MPQPAYTQTYGVQSRTMPANTALTPPAGGTGAAGGGYDTSGNRDLMIAAITATQADVLALKQVVNALIYDLKANQIIG